MGFAWRMIPRYHPQIGTGRVLAAAWRRDETPLPLSRISPDLEEGRNVFALNGGTAGMTVALKAMSLPPGSGVGVPVYSCVTVFEAVAAAGLRCVFIDVDPDTFALDLKSLRRSRPMLSALVMIHTFGFPADIQALREVLGECPIIEDCAHALGSTHHGVQVGLGGTAGIFSFNYHKPVSAGGGGLLVVNDSKLLPGVRDILAKARSGGPRGGVGGAARKIVRSATYRPPWYGLLIAAGLLGRRRDGAMESKVQIAPMSPLDRNLIRTGLERAPARLADRRAWARQLVENAGCVQPAARFAALGEAWNGYLWPVLAESPAAQDASLSFFHGRGIDAFVLWPECLRTAARFGYQSGSCPRLENALSRVMLLPCYAELTARQRARIAAAVREWRRSAG